MSALADVLAGGEAVLVADGGLATELEDQGHDLSGGLWSARLLAADQQAIKDAHLAYFRAGAVIATTASYQASFEGFSRHGIGAAGTTRLLHASVELARQAGQQATARDGVRRWVAASVGPYGAVLGNGAEYAGRYGRSVAWLRGWHQRRLEALAQAGPDLLAIETIPDADEAEAVVAAAAQAGVPFSVSFTIDGTRTRAGQPLADAFAVVAGRPQAVAAGVNCCAPGDAGPAVRLARQVTGLPAIACPNSGETWDAAAGCWRGSRGFDPALAGGWAADGARIVGGCCRVTPAQIAQVARAVAARPPGGLL